MALTLVDPAHEAVTKIPAKEIIVYQKNGVVFFYDKNDEKLSHDMLNIKEDCAGMAANQYGISKRMFVFRRFFEGPLEIAINPEIKIIDKKELWDIEGCFSVGSKENPPRYWVRRSIKGLVQYWTLKNGKLINVKEKMKDFLLRVFLHEYDHLIPITIAMKTNDKKSVLIDQVNLEKYKQSPDIQSILNNRRSKPWNEFGGLKEIPRI